MLVGEKHYISIYNASTYIQALPVSNNNSLRFSAYIMDYETEYTDDYKTRLILSTTITFGGAILVILIFTYW